MKENTWQVFDSEGKIVASVTAENIASACKKVRDYGIDFPTLVEMPKDVAVSIRQVVDGKTAVELFIAGVIEENIEKFETNTGVPVQNIDVKMLERDDYTDPFSIFVNIELDLNNIN